MRRPLLVLAAAALAVTLGAPAYAGSARDPADEKVTAMGKRGDRDGKHHAGRNRSDGKHWRGHGRHHRDDDGRHGYRSRGHRHYRDYGYYRYGYGSPYYYGYY